MTRKGRGGCWGVLCLGFAVGRFQAKASLDRIGRVGQEKKIIKVRQIQVYCGAG